MKSKQPQLIPSGWVLLCCILLGAVDAFSQQTVVLGSSSYDNRLFVPAPNPALLGATNAQPESMAFFMGRANKPSGGTISQVKMGFGQAVESRPFLRPKANLGGALIPDEPQWVGVAPDAIEPSTGAYWLASQSKIIATAPGLVNITWGGSTRQYLISAQPAQTPMALYWSQTSNGEVGGPAVDVNASIGIQFLWNTAVPSGSLQITQGKLTATKAALGSIVLVYTNKLSGAFVGLELVDVRSSDLEQSQSLFTDVGTFLAPSLTVTNPGPVVYRKGLNEDIANRFIKTLSRPGDPVFDGKPFAFRPTTGQGQINVFWTRVGLSGMVWPYEMDSYTAQWPQDFAQKSMRIYLTEEQNGTVATTSPTVDLSQIPSVVIHYNSEIPDVTISGQGHSANMWMVGKSLHAANATGRILLHYENVVGLKANGFLGFQLVEVVPNVPDNLTTATIGIALAPDVSFDVPPLPGKVTKGTQLPVPGPSYVYVHDVDGPMKGFIYPVRPAATKDIEVFWMRKGVQDIAWPYEMHRYGAAWPADPQIFVRGHTPDALGALVDLPSQLNAELKYQEPVNTATLVGATRLDASRDGLILLKYSTGNPAGTTVGFKVVHSVLHTSQPRPSADWNIGSEITDAAHQRGSDPVSSKPGYVHVASDVLPLENRYALNVYTNNGQIFPVNTGNLEVWWMNLDSDGVQWPSVVRRYRSVWPSALPSIVIASRLGTGPIDAKLFPNPLLYFQNDPTLAGFNPNDEHAVVDALGQDRAIFALRNDLGSPATSLPYVLMSYSVPGQLNKVGFKVWNVVAEDSTYRFQYPGLAGRQLLPPFPVSLMANCGPNRGVSGPFWQDRNQNFWSMAAGNDGQGTNIVMQWYYKAIDTFYFPTLPTSRAGVCVPWLDVYASTPGISISVAHTIYWPDAIPQALSQILTGSPVPHLGVGETLIDAKAGLPDIGNQCSVEVLYQQSLALKSGASVALIDPTRERTVPLTAVPADVPTERIGGKTFFKNLPLSLRTRLYFDDANARLAFRGTNVSTLTGSYLMPNVITAREKLILLDPSFRGSSSSFLTALNALVAATAQPLPSSPNDTKVDSTALTAGVAAGHGYVTLAMGTSTNRCQSQPNVSLEIIKVECPLYSGNLQIIEPGSPFEDKLAMRFDAEFGGFSDKYVFDWRYIADVDGTFPELPSASNPWTAFQTTPVNGLGALDISIGGAGPLTLSDNWLVCRYRSTDTNNPCGTNTWSDWSAPQLQEGWIKRVVKGLNPFEQRFKDLGNPTRSVNTTVSMISQAGKRWEGGIPLDPAKTDSFGLIELYETVLKQAMKLSIDAVPPQTYGNVNDQLMLVAGRLSDLYMLLGNEAFADASDPTISVGASPDLAYVAASPSIHAFMDQVPNLLEEELGLLRGRDNVKAPGVSTPPFYNRFVWNFTGDFGETAYVLKHQVTDELGNSDGFIDERDAAIIYPQGHGDAWGHYLTSTKFFYRLLRSANFKWVPQSEATVVGGIPVTVNYANERKFARAAAAKAKAGAEIVNLTYRQYYDENADNQWKGYKDGLTSVKSPKIATKESRAWGLSEWGQRAGQAALFDWMLGNALLPDVDTDSHDFLVQKVDRTTVIELAQVAASLDSIQSEMDKADTGLNPLGLSKDVMPFDIDSSQITESGGKTHFEQIYARAVNVLNNALTVFNYANSATQQLRRQADDATEFNKVAAERTADFKNRLIEIYGTPYPEDMGNGGQTYPAGYDGPDTQHYDYVDPSVLVGVPAGASETFTVGFKTVIVNDDGSLEQKDVPYSFNVSKLGYGLVKPASWTGKRQASGEIQMARSDLLQARFRFQQAVTSYGNHITSIRQESDNLRALYRLQAKEIRILNAALATRSTLDVEIANATERAMNWRRGARIADEVAAAAAEMLPLNFVAGTSAGGDLTSVARGALRLAGSAISEGLQYEADQEDLEVLDAQQAKEHLDSQSNIDITTERSGFDALSALGRLRELVRQEAPQRVEIQSLQEALQQSAARYSSALARGLRLLQDYQRFQKETAAKVQTTRYKDMAFRIFRNDALQKYQAQFDLAATYVYMAARAFDYETNFDPDDSRSPRGLMSRIVRSRAIGLIQDGQPQVGGATGDPGLTDAMARMFSSWLVLQGQLGFNNPSREEMQFSLRKEFFRIPAAGITNDLLWRATLERMIVPNLYDLPQFKRYARFVSARTVEPGLVIPFSTTIDLGLNFFGRPLGGGDHAYDSSHFATKIRSVGVWFNNFNNLALSDTPRVFLIPVGSDVMRSPAGNLSRTREWKIVEQSIPLPSLLGGTVPSELDWTPVNDTLSESFVDIRQYAPFRAYHDAGYNRSQVTYDSRLIGRSVWNTEWWLVIPAGFLSSDRTEGLQRLINGASVNGTRDGNGIKDILMLFQTYSYQGR